MKVSRNDMNAIIKEARVSADAESLRDDIPFREQGLDSLDVFNIILQVQERYHLEVPDSEIDRLNKISAIVQYLEEKLP